MNKEIQNDFISCSVCQRNFDIYQGVQHANYHRYLNLERKKLAMKVNIPQNKLQVVAFDRQNDYLSKSIGHFEDSARKTSTRNRLDELAKTSYSYYESGNKNNQDSISMYKQLIQDYDTHKRSTSLKKIVHSSIIARVNH